MRPMQDGDEYRRMRPDDKTNCDMMIMSVQPEHIGRWTCAPFLEGSSVNAVASGMLVEFNEDIHGKLGDSSKYSYGHLRRNSCRLQLFTRVVPQMAIADQYPN